ncbi:MAG: class I SAM-dependent methyltransferase [Kiritimatiellae bacterium]|nr:class I SAM-dependent methyltransferase [Kiritimatiellia bacterium]
MANEKSARMSLAARALGMLRSRRLKRYAGTDLSVIEEKVADYYASQEGAAYYSTLATQDIWEDMARHTDFLEHFQTARDILDFGCGAGGLSVALSRHDPEKRIHAIDIGTHAAALIAQAHANVNFQPGSVLDAPLEDASIDMLISRFVIEHTTHPDKLVSEAYRILRRNGVIYLLYPQLLLKVTFATALREICSWAFNPDRLTYLDPQIGATTSDADDQDAVWLTNPVKICRLLKKAGLKIERNVPTQSLIIARKS